MSYHRFIDTDDAVGYSQTNHGAVVTLSASARDFVVINSMDSGIRYDVEAGSFSATQQFLDKGEFRVHTTNATGDVSIEIFPAHRTAALVRENATDPFHVRTVFVAPV